MAEFNIFQVLLNQPRLARAVNDLLGAMLRHGVLDAPAAPAGDRPHRLAHRMRLRVECALARFPAPGCGGRRPAWYS
jgi:hypothetical protein